MGDVAPPLDHADALLIAATAAVAINKRAVRGGTDAVTYEGVRDAVLDALAPFVSAEPAEK